MSETGIIAYDLASGVFCEECHRPKGNRWLLGVPSGCATCDDVITQHRCTDRPPKDELDIGQAWECPDCGTVWGVVPEEDTCGECGRSGTEKRWKVIHLGDRIDTAPRYQPYVPTPFRNLLASRTQMEAAGVIAQQPMRNAVGRREVKIATDGAVAWAGCSAECYSLPSGAMVHVKPGCRS
jgi:hypothetical protein